MQETKHHSDGFASSNVKDQAKVKIPINIAIGHLGLIAACEVMERKWITNPNHG